MSTRERVPTPMRDAAVAVMLFTPGVALPAIASLLTAAIFTRRLSAESYGIAAFALATAMAIATISTQWLQQGALRYLPVASDAAEKRRIKDVLGASMLLVTMLAVACALLALLIAPHLLASSQSRYLLPGAVLVIVAVPFLSARTLLQAELRSGAYSACQTAVAIGGLLFALAWNSMDNSGVALLWGPALAIAVVLPVLWSLAGLRSPIFLVQNVRALFDSAGPIIRYGTPMIGWFIATAGFDLGNRFVINATRGAAELGVYTASFTLMAGAATLVAAPINLTLHPQLMRSMDRDDPGETGRTLMRLMVAGAAATVLVVIATLIFARPLAHILLGPEFQAGYRIFPIAVAAALIWQIAMIAHKPVEYARRTGALLVAAATLAVVNLGANFVLVKRYGFTVAPYTTATCYVAYVIWVLLLARSPRERIRDAM